MTLSVKQQQNKVDQRIVQLHAIALSECRKMEKLIDELKVLGSHSHSHSHSRDRDNALANTRDHLVQLSHR